jgi:hypothetical protein
MNIMNKLGVVAFAVAAISAAPAIAGPITGGDSLYFLSTSVVPAGSDLSTATSVNMDTVLFGTGTGDFSAVPSGTLIGNSTLDLSNLGNYSWTSTEGTFTAASTVTVGSVTIHPEIIGHSSTATSQTLEIYLVGTFTPSATGDLAAYASNSMSETLTFNETISGATKVFSGSATLAAPAVPPPSVPEPATLSIFGVALAGVGLARRRRA